jgi:hypothetical protein
MKYFKYDCFVRKDVSECADFLRMFGYEDGVNEIGDCTEARCGLYNGKRSYTPYFCAEDSERMNTVRNSIDCGTNIMLFFAIAALSDDTDKYQWFYSTGWTDFEGNPLPDKWVFCDQDTLEHFAWVNNSPNTYKTGWKKANVEELINHFGKDE